LGKFSPTHWTSVYIAQFLSKISEVAKMYGATFFHGRSYLIILAKNGFGYILGDFFNSSGHPGRSQLHVKMITTESLECLSA
jgi:hypothetical protein